MKKEDEDCIVYQDNNSVNGSWVEIEKKKSISFGNNTFLRLGINSFF